MGQLSIQVYSYMATEGYEDVENGNLIAWKRGDEAWWIPSPSYPIREPVLVIIDSGRGTHKDAPMNTEGFSEPVYEVIFPDGRYSVCGAQLRHKNFRPASR